MKKRFIVEGLDCASCAAKIEKAINELEGVHEASLSFLTRKLIIDAEKDQINEIVLSAKNIIQKLEPDIRISKA